MGIFDEKQISVGTITAPLLNAEPTSIITTVIRSVLANEDISDSLLQRSAVSISLQMDGLYDWAKLNYTAGLPKGKTRDGT